MLIPYRDDSPIPIFPRITLLLMFANLNVFTFELWQRSQGSLRDFILAWGLTPLHVTQGFDLQAVLTFVTSLFLHSGWLHFLGNMLYLWVFGNNVEASLGDVGYLLFYVVCGGAALGLHVLFAPGSELPVIGASGAIAGLLGAYLVAYPRARIRVFFFLFVFRTFKVSALALLGVWFGLQLLNGAASLGEYAASGGVAYFAHVGGFLAGAALMALFRLLPEE
jgi:membrane associated rhomboid family serine protease